MHTLTRLSVGRASAGTTAATLVETKRTSFELHLNKLRRMNSQEWRSVIPLQV